MRGARTLGFRRLMFVLFVIVIIIIFFGGGGGRSGRFCSAAIAGGLALVRETARACGGDAVAVTSVLGGLAVRTTWPLA